MTSPRRISAGKSTGSSDIHRMSRGHLASFGATRRTTGIQGRELRTGRNRGTAGREVRPQNQSKFCFFSSAKVLRESRGSFAKELCYFDGRPGLPTLCISAMILVALQNNSLIDVLCNRKYCLYVKLIFSVFILSNFDIVAVRLLKFFAFTAFYASAFIVILLATDRYTEAIKNNCRSNRCPYYRATIGRYENDRKKRRDLRTSLFIDMLARDRLQCIRIKYNLNTT